MTDALAISDTQSSYQEVQFDKDTKNIEYCPVWTLSSSGKKVLLKIKIRMKGDSKFLDISTPDLGNTGLTIREMLEYLDRSDACRVTADKIK